MITDQDIKQLQLKGVSIADFEYQIETFRKGFEFATLSAPALLGEGIIRVEDPNPYISKYDQSGLSTVKFVPASGAASRMFKQLFEFLNSDAVLTEDNPVYTFFKRLEHFAFYQTLKEKFLELNGYALEEAHLKKEYREILSVILNHEGMNYGKLPKGLLEFHAYEEGTRKPAKEHLVEGIAYAKKGNEVNLHFTVSPEHLPLFQEYIGGCIRDLDSGIKVKCEYSVQDPGTDTVAVTLANEPYRVDGKLLFRPAGHGALLKNLDSLKEDLVFIKNIDNVVPDRIKAETIRHKKILAGILLDYQDQVFNLLRMNETTGENIREKGKKLLAELGLKGDLTERQVIEKLNRPIRVCGMVKNEGEPGGGPFWVTGKDGLETLQIVESVQVDSHDKKQKAIFQQSSHFNPVDLVCGLKDYKGQKFDLMRYRDKSAGIITEKSVGSTKVKAMELPGLWNGSMADWNTLFVEVPLITFNPVKTVMDLLRTEHQPN